ncbi:uncharacterized protein TRUGW13939_06442 [Talaromyces rugulosus]|uniref:Uncharacterized protein n=1 Tax=Talaromyces rugulosus TaxID=121627 RepID=A0A7H8QYX7_TALRU|nr:uncharacterized protein TRUGW13939_06442 [Talaromyces rugulosus]QKX59310.1 hypothetical protein TRUGW13939_06442 [Talaromyces rugulosus]
MESNRFDQKSTATVEKIQRLSYMCLGHNSNDTTIVASTDTVTNTAPPVESSAKKSNLNIDKALTPLPLIRDIPQLPSHPRWYWKCHKCQRRWKMGVTQRCLSCNHRMCSGDPTEVKVCKTVFDYEGWRRWGEWRKDLKRRHDEQPDQEGDDKIVECMRPAKRRLFSVGLQYKKHSCWDDCVYPSQCYHEEGGLTGTLSPIGEEEEEEYGGEELEEEYWYLCEKEALFDEEWYVEEEKEEVEEEENDPGA